MADWIGLIFFVLLIAGIFIGLKVLSKRRVSTEAEFERSAAENTTMLGASMNALQQIMDPAEARAKEVRTQLKEGHYNKRQGKADGDGDAEEIKN